MRAAQVGPSDWLWKEGAGYYTGRPEDLAERPVLPDLRRLRDRRLYELFQRFGDLSPRASVLELGCGRSAWLPFLARRHGCRVAGIDVEPYAADLARANLAGAGAAGEILCGDAFGLAERRDLRGRFDLVYSMGLLEHFADVVDRIRALARYLRPGGRVLTTVPNLQGLNWMLQRLADRRTLQAHVVYDAGELARVHARAGFETLGSGYAGFCDGHLSSAAGAAGRLRRVIHRRACRSVNLSAEAWARLGRGVLAPELRWVSPHVFYAGRLA